MFRHSDLLIFTLCLMLARLILPTEAAADNSPGQAPIPVESIWAEHPLSLAAGTEMSGCISYRLKSREDVLKDDWTMEAITFQQGMSEAIYLELDGQPEVLETADCVIVRLTQDMTFELKDKDYFGMGRAEIVEVTHYGKYNQRN